MAVRTGSRFMVGAIIAALALTFEMIPPPAVAQPAPRDALAGIRARRDVAVCMWPQYFAISYRNPRNSELEGIDIDMARALAARLGVTLRFVETNFASFMDRIEAGDCDIAMMAVGVLPARAARVNHCKRQPST